MIYVILTGILFTLSFSNPIFLYGIQGLAFIALVPALFEISRSSTIKKTFRLGQFFGILATCGPYYWMKNYGEYSIWILTGMSLVYIFEYAMLFSIFWICYTRIQVLFRPLVIALFWVGFEYFKSRGFLAFPWSLLAHSVAFTPLNQLARLTGTWGISFVLAYANALIVEGLIYMSPKKISKYHLTHYIAPIKGNIMIFSTILILSLGYGVYNLMMSHKHKPNGYINTLLIQQNLDSWDNISPQDSLTHIINLNKKALKEINTMPTPDLLVWSETSLVIPYQLNYIPYANSFYNNIPDEQSFISFIQETNIPLLTGTPQYDEEKEGIAYNSSILIKPNGDLIHKYGKNFLVPFAEYVPFYNIQLMRKIVAAVLGLSGSWLPYGSFNTLDLYVPQDTLLEYKGVPHYSGLLKIGTPICFEDSFSNATRAFATHDANLLINLTNLSWAKTVVAEVQQLVISKFRSIETGLTMLRSTNTGITSVIDPWGRILKEIPPFEDNYLYTKAYIYTNNDTLYLFWGDFIGILGLLSIAIYGIYLMYKKLFKKEEIV